MADKPIVDDVEQEVEAQFIDKDLQIVEKGQR